jgi:hypothetical protein
VCVCARGLRAVCVWCVLACAGCAEGLAQSFAKIAKDEKASPWLPLAVLLPSNRQLPCPTRLVHTTTFDVVLV